MRTLRRRGRDSAVSDWPKVSVIISTYNRPEMLQRALRSVLGQTFRDFEVVVIDDGSATGAKVCADLADDFKDAGIRLIAGDLPENTGYQSAPKNAGIMYARGAYIAYLDDDNEWDPEHLELLVNEIEKGGADLVYSRWRYKGDGPMSGQDSMFCTAHPASLLGLQGGPQYNFIDTSAILHSKAAVALAVSPAPWNEEIRRFGDWELVGSCAQNGLRFRGVDAVTFTYWWHGENLQLTRRPDERTHKTERPNIDWSGAGDSLWRG